MNILLVDDEEVVRDSVGSFLKKNGDTVFTTGKEHVALELIASYPVEVAIFDYFLKGRGGMADGIELINKSKKIRPGISYIIITGVGSMRQAIESYNTGAHSFLKKPIDLTDLLSKLDSIRRTRNFSNGVDKIISSWQRPR